MTTKAEAMGFLFGDSRVSSPFSPNLCVEVLEIYRNLGFATSQEWDEFWTSRNVHAGVYERPDATESSEREDLIKRAQAGEKIDVRGLYAKLDAMTSFDEPKEESA